MSILRNAPTGFLPSFAGIIVRVEMIKSFETLYESDLGAPLPLPVQLVEIYGKFCLPMPNDRPYVISNFVQTIDGVVTLNSPGYSGGGDISGFNPEDQFLMALLRASADAVIVGTAQLRHPPGRIWTSRTIYPQLEEQFRELRANLGRREPPLNIVVTSKGEVDLNLPIFQSGEVRVLIITSEIGAGLLRKQTPPSTVEVVATRPEGYLTAKEVLKAASMHQNSSLYLIEGGPHLLATFLDEGLLDELFLTIAPQMAGRDGVIERMGLVAGQSFAPEKPLWGQLNGIKQAQDYLFIRYGFRDLRVKES